MGGEHSEELDSDSFQRDMVLWRDFLTERLVLIRVSLEKKCFPLSGSGSIWSWFFILISAFHNYPSNDGFLIFSLCSFNSVCQGTHILFREFSFIQATPHNRASFLRAFWRCFRTVGKNGGKSSQILFLPSFLPFKFLFFFLFLINTVWVHANQGSRHTLLLRSHLSCVRDTASITTTIPITNERRKSQA